MEHLTNENFKEKISKGMVVVDFYAQWCGPCKSFAPIFEESSNNFENIEFYKVNVEEAEKAAAEFGVMSIPTIIFFKDGQIAEQKTGMMMKSQFEEKIKELFGI